MEISRVKTDSSFKIRKLGTFWTNQEWVPQKCLRKNSSLIIFFFYIWMYHIKSIKRYMYCTRNFQFCQLSVHQYLVVVVLEPCWPIQETRASNKNSDDWSRRGQLGPKRAQNVTGLPHITKTIDANNNSKEATTATASSKGMSGAVVVLL